MEFLYEYGLFLAQAATVVIAIIVVVGTILSMGSRQRVASHEGHIEVQKLNDRYKHMKDDIQHIILSEDEYKHLQKKLKKEEKLEAKQRKKHKDEPVVDRLRLYVMNFDGDLKASATDHLREEISAVLSLARTGDEVLLKLESGGGMVHSYGFAASQLQRVVDAGIKLTVSVDKVAASGGYMMACVGDRILAAPFAIIGSIGVLAQIPNFSRLLKKANVDFEQLTAGEYKRTLTMFGENTEQGRQKLQQELEDTHILFKGFVADRRDSIEVDKIATGETWYGQQAIERGLVDELLTSDSYVQSCLAERDVFEIKYVHKKSWQEKLGMAAEGAVERGISKIWQKNTEKPY